MDPNFLNLFDSESSKGSSSGNNPVVINVTAASPPPSPPSSPPPPPPPSTQLTCLCSKTFPSAHELVKHQFFPCVQNMSLSQNPENTFHANGFIANYQLHHLYNRPQELQLFPTSPEGPQTKDFISLIDNQPTRGTTGFAAAANGADDRVIWGATIGLEVVIEVESNGVNLDLKL